jgi:hypothetical protein
MKIRLAKHIIMKFQSSRDKERTLKASSEKYLASPEESTTYVPSNFSRTA